MRSIGRGREDSMAAVLEHVATDPQWRLIGLEWCGCGCGCNTGRCVLLQVATGYAARMTFLHNGITEVEWPLAVEAA